MFEVRTNKRPPQRRLAKTFITKCEINIDVFTPYPALIDIERFKITTTGVYIF